LISFRVGVGFLHLRLEFITFCLKLCGFGAQGLGFGGVCCNYLFGFRVGAENFFGKLCLVRYFSHYVGDAGSIWAFLVLKFKVLGLVVRDDFESIHIRIASKSEGLGLRRA